MLRRKHDWDNNETSVFTARHGTLVSEWTSMTVLSCLWPLKPKYTVGIYIQGKRYTAHCMGMFVFFCHMVYKLQGMLKVNNKHDFCDKEQDRDR